MKHPWHSSYEENNYGDLFYSLIRIYRPEKVVELGTQDGYSAYHIARGLRANGQGTLDCYDLWENHIEYYGLDFTSKSAAQENLEEFKQIINLELSDAVGVDKKYGMIDILHVDLDNDGALLEKIIPAWIDKIRQLIIIEGGSFERDEIERTTNRKKMPVSEWLDDFKEREAGILKELIPDESNKKDQYVIVKGDEKYKKKPIERWLEDFSRKRGDIEYLTIEPFPSITIIRKK